MMTKGFAAVFVLLSAPAYAAPFDIPMSTPLRDLRRVAQISDTLFEVIPPTKNSNFVRYLVVATPRHGVCQVIAQTAPLPSDAALTVRYESIRRLVSSRYGTPTPVLPADSKVVVSLGTDGSDSEWVSLARKPLPDGISSIMVERNGLLDDTKTKRVSVAYAYRNLSDCYSWEKGQDRRGL